MRTTLTIISLILALLLLSFAPAASALPSPTRTIERLRGPYASRPEHVRLPSASPSASAKRRNVPTPAKRSIDEQDALGLGLTHELVSSILCPAGTRACPLADTSTPSSILDWMYECADFATDLTSCGGCAAIDQKHDCTAIPNALAVSCVQGGCAVHSCEPGFAPTANGTSCIEATSIDAHAPNDL